MNSLAVHHCRVRPAVVLLQGWRLATNSGFGRFTGRTCFPAVALIGHCHLPKLRGNIPRPSGASRWAFNSAAPPMPPSVHAADSVGVSYSYRDLRRRRPFPTRRGCARENSLNDVSDRLPGVQPVTVRARVHDDVPTISAALRHGLNHDRGAMSCVTNYTLGVAK